MRRGTATGVFAAGLLLLLIVACGGDDGQGVARSESSSIPSSILVHLVDPLDDPGYYCIDVVGFGSGALFRDALQAHTCKPDDNEDQQFAYRLSPLQERGQLFMDEYGLCLQPEILVPGAELFLRECSPTPLQSFGFFGDGFIRLGEAGPGQLCVAVAPGEGERINSIHKRRDIGLSACDGGEPGLMRWAFSAEAPERVAEAN